MALECSRYIHWTTERTLSQNVVFLMHGITRDPSRPIDYCHHASGATESQHPRPVHCIIQTIFRRSAFTILPAQVTRRSTSNLLNAYEQDHSGTYLFSSPRGTVIIPNKSSTTPSFMRMTTFCQGGFCLLNFSRFRFPIGWRSWRVTVRLCFSQRSVGFSSSIRFQVHAEHPRCELSPLSGVIYSLGRCPATAT